MDGWYLAVYAVAALLSLHSLVWLMTNHKREFTKKLMAEETAKRRAGAARAKAEEKDEPVQDEKADQAAA